MRNNLKFLKFLAQRGFFRVLPPMGALCHAAFNKSRHTLTDRRINMQARINLLESLVRSKLLYSVQAWQLSQEELRKLEVVYRNFLRKMIRGGFRKVGANGAGKCEHAFVVSNKKLYEITRTRPLADFVNKQFLKYTAHVTRMSNSSWQKKLLFAKSRSRIQSTWSKCQDLLQMDESQIRKTMQNPTEFGKLLDTRFGKRAANNPSESKFRGKTR